MVLSLIGRVLNSSIFWLVLMALNTALSIFVSKDLESAYFYTCITYIYYSSLQTFLNPDFKEAYS